jgi:hypothetical protein
MRRFSGMNQIGTPYQTEYEGDRHWYDLPDDEVELDAEVMA